MKNEVIAEKNVHKSKHRVLKSVLIALAVVLIAGGITCAVLLNRAYAAYLGPEVTVIIPGNADDEAVEKILCTSLGDEYAGNVILMMKLRRATFAHAHGAFTIKPGDKAWSVMNRLRTGTQTPVNVTFNNQRTVHSLAGQLAKHLEADSADIEAAMARVLENKGYTPETFIVAFAPDTYQFYYNIAPDSLIASLASASERLWSADRALKANKLGLSRQEVYTLASIVEAETNNLDERPVVARLYLNRLNKGMKLQADPTAVFASGKFDTKRVTSQHTSVDNLYNTYMYHGLPPGPIRMVEIKSVDAVLNAPDNNYLYMCAKEDFSGRHNFAADYQTHQANARRYQQALNKLDIKSGQQ